MIEEKDIKSRPSKKTEVIVSCLFLLYIVHVQHHGQLCPNQLIVSKHHIGFP